MEVMYSDDQGNIIYGKPKKINGKFNYQFKESNTKIYIESEVVVFTNVTIQSVGNGNTIKIGRNCNIKGELLVAHTSLIVIAKRVKFNAACRIHAAEGKKIMIGDDCLFANVRFRTSDSYSMLDLDTQQRLNLAEDRCGQSCLDC